MKIITMTICPKQSAVRLETITLMAAFCLLFASCGLLGGGEESPPSSVPSSSQQEESALPTVSVTIPEGLTAREIADHLEINGVCKAEDFLTALTTGTFDYPFLTQIPDDERIYLRLEGYLFPDTYEFYLDEAPADVIARFLSNFQARVDDALLAEIERQAMTLHEVVTLASIVQEEAIDPAEMAMVSSVFHNRLQSVDFPKLQSDVTIFYVRLNIEPYVTEEENTTYFKAYSTYDCNDLPVGPICSPGLDAIKAAINPEQSDYYYFLTDKTGKFYYAKTYKVHSANWEEAKAVNAALNAQTAGASSQD